MFPTLLDMSTQLNVHQTLNKINVVSYDYSGYGESEGSASENVIYDDIEEVADFIIYSLNIPAENILLYCVIYNLEWAILLDRLLPYIQQFIRNIQRSQE